MKTLLIVDDCETDVEILRSAAEDAGLAELSIVAASDGDEGLKAIDEHKPDLVLVDLNMPRMGGFELLAEARRRKLQIPMVVYSTSMHPGDIHRSLSLSARAYVVKPSLYEDVVALVRATHLFWSKVAA